MRLFYPRKINKDSIISNEMDIILKKKTLTNHPTDFEYFLIGGFYIKDFEKFDIIDFGNMS